MILRSIHRRGQACLAIAIAVTAVAPGGADGAPPGPAAGGDLDEPAALEVDVRPSRQIATPGANVASTAATTPSPATTTGAAAWHAAGITGAGVRVGVIDFFDVTLHWDEAILGPRPVAGVTARCFDRGTDCTGEFFDGRDDGGEDHGVAVVEMVRSMAPDAQIFIGRATTIADYTNLVDWFASQGVRVVNRSLGSRYDGPGDGRGPLDDVAAAAVATGMTWVNSAGNAGTDQYYREPVRLASRNVAFGPSGDDRFLEARGCLSLAGMRWANDWDRPPGERTDYDLYLWESPTGDPAAGSIVARSELRQTSGAAPLEHLGDSRCPTSGTTLYLEIRWVGGDIGGDIIEILDYANGFAEHTSTSYSAAVSIVDSDASGVVAVGAVDPPESGTIGTYSSQGPTNDGRIAPDISAPSGFRSEIYGGRFSGTSAAAAVTTGAGALFLQARVAGDASNLGDLLRHATVDRGSPGPDDIYGHGELRLPPPPAALDDAPSRYVALDAPTRFLDTRPESPVGPDSLTGQTWAGEIRHLPIAGVGGVPATATSVAVNLTTVRPDRRSYVQALPIWQSTLGGYSNLNADAAGQNRANFGIVPIADDGSIALYSTAAGHLVVDVLGWFEPFADPTAAGRFVALDAAQRVLDTRTGSGPVPSGTTVTVPSPGGLPLAEVSALVVTVTAVRPSAVGWLQALPTGRPELVGTTSTVNTSPGNTAASIAIVSIAGGGVAVHAEFGTGGSSHVLVDVIGYMTGSEATPSGAGRFVPIRPTRAFDSRPSGTRLVDAQTVVVDAAAPGIGVPTDATAVMWNLTAVNPTRRGYASGWATDEAQPATSVLNWSYAGEVRAAAAVTGVSSGRTSLRVDDEGALPTGELTHLLADVFGYFT